MSISEAGASNGLASSPPAVEVRAISKNFGSRINAVGALVAVYSLATGTAGFQLVGAQQYIQQIFYGAALVAAVTIPKVTRRRIFKRAPVG